MMDAQRLLRRLHDAGFQLRADDDELVIVPESNLTPAILSRVKSRKAELLDLLAGSAHPTPDETVECIDCGQALPLSGVRCPSCRDAHPDPTCGSCGAGIVDPESRHCHPCLIGKQVEKMQESERRVA